VVIAFVASFYAAGIPYWLIPYNKLNLPRALMEPSLLVVIFTTLNTSLIRNSIVLEESQNHWDYCGNRRIRSRDCG
jgi:hypothetical protein